MVYELPIFKTLEWFGGMLAVSGAILLSFRVRISPVAWVLWLLSNFCLMALFYYTRQHGVLVSQCVFTVTSLVGIIRWIYIPYRRTGRWLPDPSPAAGP